METHNGMIVAAENVGGGEYRFTVKTNKNGGIQLGTEVVVIDRNKCNLVLLNELYDYLIDRPALMDDNEVKYAISSLKSILNLS